MSADFNLSQNMPKIKIQTQQVSSNASSSTDINNRSPIHLRENNKEEDNSEFECHTPTSEENKIPKRLLCSPPPRKPRRAIPSCKRKLTEFQFFEIVNSEEIDSFFRSSIEQLTAKRRSSCI